MLLSEKNHIPQLGHDSCFNRETLRKRCRLCGKNPLYLTVFFIFLKFKRAQPHTISFIYSKINKLSYIVNKFNKRVFSIFHIELVFISLIYWPTATAHCFIVFIARVRTSKTIQLKKTDIDSLN